MVKDDPEAASNTLKICVVSRGRDARGRSSHSTQQPNKLLFHHSAQLSNHARSCCKYLHPSRLSDECLSATDFISSSFLGGGDGTHNPCKKQKNSAFPSNEQSPTNSRGQGCQPVWDRKKAALLSSRVLGVLLTACQESFGQSHLGFGSWCGSCGRVKIGSRFPTGWDRLRRVVLECVLTISQLLVMFDLSAEALVWPFSFNWWGFDVLSWRYLGGQTGWTDTARHTNR